MLSQLAEAVLPRPLSQRLWLRRHDSFAAKQPGLWVEQAKKLNLDKFRSFPTQDGITVYQYDGYCLGEIQTDADGKQITNSLSDFFNAMRMVVIAYERTIAVANEALEEATGEGASSSDKVSTHPIIVLQPAEYMILTQHPNFLALLHTNDFNHWQSIELQDTGSCVYRITVSDIDI